MGKHIILRDEFQALNSAFVHALDKLKLPNLSIGERKLNKVKSDAIKNIFDFIDCITSRSERHEVFFNLCLGVGRCTDQIATKLGYSREESLRFAKNQFRLLLESTVLNGEQIDILIHSNSVDEVLEVLEWYQVCVFDNEELLRPIGRGGKG